MKDLNEIFIKSILQGVVLTAIIILAGYLYQLLS